MTLYMTIGGRQAIVEALPHLRARLETDPCFDMDRFQEEFGASGDLAEFLIFLFGGAPSYDGKSVAALLSPLCTCSETYERFTDHLAVVFLSGNDTPEAETNLRDLMERLRPHVLHPKPLAPVEVYSVEPEMLSA